MDSQLLIGKPDGSVVEFNVVVGFDKRLRWQDVIIVNEFNTSIQESENVLCTVVPADVEITGVPSTNDNLLDVCVNRQQGEIVRINGSICPVRNATCIECLRIKEISNKDHNFAQTFVDRVCNGDVEHKDRNFVEVWVCPFRCRTIDQCKLSK